MIVYNKVFSIVFLCFLFVACNPGKQLNKGIAERNKQAAEQAKIVFPLSKEKQTPENVNYVYDFESLYSPLEQRKLDTLLRNFERSNLIAIKLVSLSSQYMQGKSFEENKKELLNDWEHVHGNSGKTMLVLISKEQRQSAVSYGTFVGKFINNEEINTIIASERPVFETGDFFSGTWSGLNKVMDTIRKNLVYRPSSITK